MEVDVGGVWGIAIEQFSRALKLLTRISLVRINDCPFGIHHNPAISFA
jgi:hypothetical protein